MKNKHTFIDLFRVVEACHWGLKWQVLQVFLQLTIGRML